MGKAPPRVIAWDGEGVTLDRNAHRYVLLASSAGHRLVTPAGVDPGDAFTMLAGGLAEPGAHVGFAITYDVSMLLRKLSRAHLSRLYRGLPCFWATPAAYFRIQWRQRHYLRVHMRDRSLTWRGGTLWDTWGFFQRPFVRACEDYGVGTPAERAQLTKAKARRAHFTLSRLAYIEDYNALELRLLVQLIERLRDSLLRARLPLSRWDGPGAIASKLLTREGAKERRPARAPKEVEHASRHAYYGGRSECVQYGHARRPVYQYDITSAYPSVLALAPCTSHGCGHWQHRGPSRLRDWEGDEFAVHRVRWDFAPAPLYPWPWRAPHGGVYFPKVGEGWVWTPELIAAPREGYEIVESWRWVSRCKHKAPPFAWVTRVFAERQAAAARGDPAERALKMALNCLYGKLAQRAGAEFVRGKKGGKYWRRPVFHDLALAGWITSSVRARLFDAAAAIPDSVLMIATDALYTTTQLPAAGPAVNGKALGKSLGAWTFAEWDGATIVQSGLYWLHRGDETLAHTRGIDVDAITWRDALRAWREGAKTIDADVTRFQSVGRAQQQGWRKLASWVTESRRIAVHPWATKRAPRTNAEGFPLVRPDRGFCPTDAADTLRWHGGGGLTTPTGVPWAHYDPDPESRTV